MGGRTVSHGDHLVRVQLHRRAGVDRSRRGRRVDGFVVVDTAASGRETFLERFLRRDGEVRQS